MLSDSTALITFMLEAPPDAFSVELLGSWDNFYRPYQLSRDKRAGRSQWRGCHRFENITCDGDLSDLSLKRDGALKMGGTYWYHYRLNYDWDYHDPDQPITTKCPSMPGQMLNVLEVPVQHQAKNQPPSAEVPESQVFTLDPKDKYAPLGMKRAAATSVVQRQKHIDSQAKPVVEQPPPTDFCYKATDTAGENEQYDPAQSPQQGLYSIIQRLRRTKSSCSSSQKGSFRTGSAWSRKLLSRAKSSRRAATYEDAPEAPEIPKITPELLQKVQDLSLESSSRGGMQASEVEESSTSPSPIGALKVVDDQVSEFSRSHSIASGPGCPSPLSNHNESRQASETAASNLKIIPEPKDPPITESAMNDKPMCQQNPSVETHSSTRASNSDMQHSLLNEYTQSTQSVNVATDPEASEYSPELDSSTTGSRRISSIMLEQPETPRMLEFDDTAVVWQRNSDPGLEAHHSHESSVQLTPAMLEEQQNMGGFQGYSLPIHDHASMVTIKKPSTRNGIESSQANTQCIRPWDEGIPQQAGIPTTVLNELGYLGALIS